MDESKNWGLSLAELERALQEMLDGPDKDVCHPRAIIVINPGNPTGQVLPRNNIEDIIKFALRNKLVILADEVSSGLYSLLNKSILCYICFLIVKWQARTVLLEGYWGGGIGKLVKM